MSRHFSFEITRHLAGMRPLAHLNFGNWNLFVIRQGGSIDCNILIEEDLSFELWDFLKHSPEPTNENKNSF